MMKLSLQFDEDILAFDPTIRDLRCPWWLEQLVESFRDWHCKRQRCFDLIQAREFPRSAQESRARSP